MKSALGVVAFAVFALASTVASAQPMPWPTIGGRPGEIDLSTTFVGLRGDVEPTVRESSHQSAEVNAVIGGAGYSIGEIGPFYDAYARVEGGYFTADDERVETLDDDLPPGFAFYPRDQSGFVSGLVAANVAKGERFSFGLFLRGTVPIEVDLAKFSNLHLHWVAGGASFDVALTDPDEIVRLRLLGRFFVGSGVYEDDAQHNAQAALTTLFGIEAGRWLLPWPIGLRVGPHFEGDLNEHVNPAYHAAYGAVDPDLVEDDEVRELAFSVAILPYVHFTEHISLELGYTHTLFGYDLQSTQEWLAGVRTAF